MYPKSRAAVAAALAIAVGSFAGAASAQVTFTGSYAAASAIPSADVNFTLTIVNGTGTAVTNGTFTYTLPTNLTRQTPNPTYVGCGIPNTTFSTTTSFSPAFIFVNPGATCTITTPVRSAVAATYGISASNMTFAGAAGSPVSLSPGPQPTLVISTPTPVPTMSEWAMILFGTVLAGGAALYIQRRRQLG